MPPDRGGCFVASLLVARNGRVNCLCVENHCEPNFREGAFELVNGLDDKLDDELPYDEDDNPAKYRKGGGQDDLREFVHVPVNV